MKFKSILFVMLLAFTSVIYAEAALVKIGGGLRVGHSEIERKLASSAATDSIDGKNSLMVYASLEHGISFLPNYKIQRTSSEYKDPVLSDTNKVEQISHSLYYSFGLAVVDIELGAGLDSVDLGKGPNDEDISYSSANISAKVSIDVPLFPVQPALFVSQGIDDSDGQSVSVNGVNVAVTFFPGSYVDLGYETHDFSYNSRSVADQEQESQLTEKVYYLGVGFSLGL